MTDTSHAAASRTMPPPDNIWFAHWNGLKNTSDQASYPAFPNSDWKDHQRLHQYEGNLNQAWGVGISMDADWVDGGVAGTLLMLASVIHHPVTRPQHRRRPRLHQVAATADTTVPGCRGTDRAAESSPRHSR